MSQPDMQPEGVPHDGHGQGAGAGARESARGGTEGSRSGDLTGRAFPLGDWGEPAERLDELYRWVERGALNTAAWYLSDRAWKRRGARLSRVGAALGGVG
ncbi:SLATT domain-containing protein, partial [Streptomyces sp. MZ04]|uniref:SLATT domain-containing protein n=1 Tax=Streptomyces sp. MZ04 TaxID=2559236 RepID=UPI00107EE5E6